MRKLWPLFIGFLFSISLNAQNRGFEYIDTSIIEPEYGYYDETVDSYDIDTSFLLQPPGDFNDSIQSWKTSSSYRYIHALDSILRKRKEKAMNVEDARTERSSSSNVILKILESRVFHWLLWIIAGAALLYILYKFFADSDFRRRNVKKYKPVEDISDEELIPPGSFEHLIREAVEQQDYRLATRYCFLQCLSMLTQQNIIAFANDKTNSDYKREMPERLQSGFSKLALRYEYIWYGRQRIDETQFREIESLFREFNQKIAY